MPCVKLPHGSSDNDYNYNESDEAWADIDPTERMPIDEDFHRVAMVPSRALWYDCHVDDVCSLWEHIQQYVADNDLPILENANLEAFVRFVLRHSWQSPYADTTRATDVALPTDECDAYDLIDDLPQTPPRGTRP